MKASELHKNKKQILSRLFHISNYLSLPALPLAHLDCNDRSQPQIVVAGRKSGARETGLPLAVATMRQGEKALIRASPEYGFGERGSFSFPSVPPHSHLEYEIELLGFEPVGEVRRLYLLLCIYLSFEHMKKEILPS